MQVPQKTPGKQRIFLVLAAILMGASMARATVTARYVRVDNPTGFAMEWRQIEVYSGGVNIILHHPEMITGTVPPTRDNTDPTPLNTILTGSREAKTITDGITDTRQRASEWRAFSSQEILDLNPWIEIDLGRPMPIDKIVLYGSRYPTRFYLDKGHRVVSALDADRRVAWAAKWQYYDGKKYPGGVFSFMPASQTTAENSVVGSVIPPRASDWVAMAWLLNADQTQPPPDAAQRMLHFADRNSPQEIARLAKRFFAEIDDRTPGLDAARRLYDKGEYPAALDAWKKYWFAKMARVNTHQALHGDYVSYRANGDDLLHGIMVTITPGEARAIRYVPGQIHWIDIPNHGGKEFSAAMEDSERKAKVGSVSWPLLYAYRRNPDPRYIQRWAEIMDDWSLNFFVDAAKSPYEVENLFTFSPATAWQTMMEDLSDIARERPELIEQIPATTLARVQLICLEKYTTAWWRQTRETDFNHVTGGLYQYFPLLPYVQEFYPGQRASREWRQGFERWMTFGTERDGSMTEIGDDGHMEMPIILGAVLKMLEQEKPVWYTPGWRNRAMEWDLNTFKYLFRHLAPGGYEHRFEVRYRPSRWTTTYKTYLVGRPTGPIDRDNDFFTIPEVRRMLDAWGHVSSGIAQPADPIWKPITQAQEQTRAQVIDLLGAEKPGMPHINSDWMPYTGAYYFRGGWADDAPFLAMLACGSHGGSQAPQWPYSMFYAYDDRFPLVAAQPIQVDGMPPQQLFGRMNCYQPGTKTMALANADEKPAPHRWLSDSRFDFGEAEFRGGYQRFGSFSGDGPTMQMHVGKAVAAMHSLRQVLQLRGSRLFIITDAVESPDHQPHEYSIPYKVSLSSRRKGGKPFNADQLVIDAPGERIGSDNPDGPSVMLYQFSDRPMQYRKGREAVLDFKQYSQRLTSDIGVADQPVTAVATGPSLSLVSVIASRDAGAADRIASIEAMNQPGGAVGFHARMKDGREVWYQSAALGAAPLTCGPGRATGQALLVVADKGQLSGILLSGNSLTLDGRKIESAAADFEFTTLAGQTTITPIYTPIDPVSFRPNRNAFIDSEMVRMVSQTPNVEIRYTTDGTPPTPASLLYTGPVKITQSTEFAARAYRLGADGRRLPADGFEINGTRFTVPSYGWFYKKPLQPAMNLAPNDLQPGLNYDYLQAPWYRLYAEAHWLAAEGGGVADREMDLSKISSDEPYGVRYKGYIKAPADGLYTFQAPHEFCYMDSAVSYDLRVYVDGQQWDLTQWWHGHGTWTIPLKAGFHRFQVDFADARSNPWRKSGIWRYFPRPWSVYQGKPTDILITGPGIKQGRIPQSWFYRHPESRPFPDDRVLIDSANQLNCAWNNAVDAPLTGVNEICFKTSENATGAFAKLIFAKPDGTSLSFAEATERFKQKQTPQGLFLSLKGGFSRLGGMLKPGAEDDEQIIIPAPEHAQPAP